MCELPEVSSSTHPIARKEHTCCECRGTIKPGERYYKFTGVWDAEWSTYKTCSDCEEIRDECDEGFCADECTPFGYLDESVDNIGEVELVKKFLAVKQKRGAPVPNWMKKYIDTTPSA